jgi:DNA-directed RNA polymerase subunit RPC12/RpoP
VSADGRIAHPQLRCAQCGLVYSRVAVAREITLSMGIDCRRCGGGLHQIDEAPTKRNEIVAVRSPVSGPVRRRFE